jgi:hypothetical protein
MQPIADWLKKLGMSECAQRFADNDIDASVLPELTDQDLKDLGVSLGHRRKLRAIRDLGGASVDAAAPAALRETKPTRQDDAERRQLTVMFTDLVGSPIASASRRRSPGSTVSWPGCGAQKLVMQQRGKCGATWCNPPSTGSAAIFRYACRGRGLASAHGTTWPNEWCGRQRTTWKISLFASRMTKKT